MKDKYLEFYKINFGTAKYCTKSWGLASFEAGAQSRQAEIDDLVDMVKTLADSKMNWFDELQRANKDRDEMQKRIGEAMEILEYNEYIDSPLQALHILKGNTND